MEDIVEYLGIDIGGSGIKGALVDTEKGTLVADRYRIPTPRPSVPEAVASTVAKIVKHFDWHGPIGCTFPAVIKQGVAWSAANVDESWIGTDGEAIISEASGCPVVLLNDADAAGIAEVTFGAGKGHKGIVFIITLGTGIGSAIFNQGVLLPNTEIGHLEIRGKDAERRAADSARKQKNMGWKKWAANVGEYLQHLEALFSPDLFILGGGVAKKHQKYIHLLDTKAEVVPAQLLNEAGIVGAALAAAELSKK